MSLKSKLKKLYKKVKPIAKAVIKAAPTILVAVSEVKQATKKPKPEADPS